MLRTPLASERIQRIDPATGLKVIQLTSYPVPSVHPPYDWPSVTPGNERLLLYSQREASRSAPWDLFRVDADGLNLFQLTERDDAPSQPSVAMELDGESAYALWSEEGILCTIDLETGNRDDLLDLSSFARENQTLGRIRIAPSGRTLYVTMPNYAEGGGCALRIDLDSGDVEEMPDVTLYGCDQTTGRIFVVRDHMKLRAKTAADGSRVYYNANDQPMRIFSTNADGSDAQFVATVDMFGHSTLLGRTSLVQGTGQPPHRCIWIAEAGKEPRKLVEGPYFWHSGASFDGEWIVADTNWPAEGLKLIHVPTGNWRTLCHNRGSQGHAQTGHAHPALSQDGRLAVFTSDVTGVVQVYVVHITDEFRESVIEGGVDQPRDKWM